VAALPRLAFSKQMVKLICVQIRSRLHRCKAGEDFEQGLYPYSQHAKPWRKAYRSLPSSKTMTSIYRWSLLC